MTTTEVKIPPGQFLAHRWAIYAALGVPRVDAAQWKLSVTGLVENPLHLSYSDLITSPLAVKLQRDFHCVTGWSIADVVWEGVPIKALADQATVKPEAS